MDAAMAEGVLEDWSVEAVAGVVAGTVSNRTPLIVEVIVGGEGDWGALAAANIEFGGIGLLEELQFAVQ